MSELKTLKKLALLPLAAVLWGIFFILFNGCSFPYERYADERNVFFVGVVNDSLALMQSWRVLNVKDNWNASFISAPADVETYTRHEGLHLVNYRKHGIYWQDTVGWEPNIKAQLSDSVMYGGDFNKYITFWKIGEKPKKVSIKKWENNDCSGKVPFVDYGGGGDIFIGLGLGKTENFCLLGTLQGQVPMFANTQFLTLRQASRSNTALKTNTNGFPLAQT